MTTRTSKRKRRLRPRVLTEMQYRVLVFLHKHRAASVQEIGRVADHESEPMSSRKYYTRQPPEGVESIGRVGAGVLIWLRKWGLVRLYHYEESRYYEITPKGRMVITTFRELMELGVRPLI